MFNHQLVRHLAYAGRHLDRDSDRVLFGFRVDDAPQLDDPVIDDDADRGRIEPLLRPQLSQYFVVQSEIVNRRFRFLRMFKAHQRLDKIGAADNADNLSVAHDRHALDPVFF